MIKDTVEYWLISDNYGDRVAECSRVPLINHVNEGLVILDKLNASLEAKRAFCLHPVLQADKDLIANAKLVKVLSTISPYAVLLAMEYRSVANAWLSDKATLTEGPKLSPLAEVNQMLIADKVQNFKDFITYHLDTHPRSAELTIYFERWLEALNVSQEVFYSLCQDINLSKRYA